MNNDINSLLKKLVESKEFQTGFLAVVRGYQSDNLICYVERINTPEFKLDKPNPANFIYDVRITAFEQDINRMKYERPVIGSYVIVNKYDNGMKFITTCTKVDRVSTIVEDGGVWLAGTNDEKVGLSLDGKEKIAILSAEEEAYLTSKVTHIAGFDEMKIHSDQNIILDGGLSGMVEISNASASLYRILSDLIDTLTTNVVPDCTLPSPYGAATGPAFAADLRKIDTALKNLLK